MTDDANPRDRQQEAALWQALSVAAVVAAAPLALAVAAVTVGLVRVTGARWWAALAPALAGVGWTLVVGPAQALDGYAGVYREAAAALPDQLATVAASAWVGWLVALAPASLTGGGLAAAAITGWWRWHRPEWRQDHPGGERIRPRRARRRARQVADGSRQATSPDASQPRPRRRRRGPAMVTLGVDPAGEPVGVSRQQLAHHALLVGASGSGKTTSLLQLTGGAIRGGHPLVAVDLKGTDAAVADALRREAHAAGRPFRHWSLQGPCRWNPLARGDATRLRDKLVAGEQWSEPHYQRLAERHLQWVARVLLARPDAGPPTLAEVVRHADPERLHAVLRQLPAAEAEAAQGYLDELDSRTHRDLKGTIARLATVTESIAGPWLEPADDDAAADDVDLVDAMQRQAVVLFSLPSGDYPQVCAQLAGMALIDLQTAAAGLQRQQWGGQAFVAVDEFSALDGTHLLGLLARGRGAGVSVWLSTQELADLQTARPEFADQVIANTGCKLAHRVQVPASAEQLAAMAGTRRAWETTHQVHEHARRARADQGTGLGSLRQVDEFVIHPNELKQLPQGRAVLLTSQPTAAVRRLDVIPTPTPVGADEASATSGEPVDPPASEPDPAETESEPAETESEPATHESVDDVEELCHDRTDAAA